MEAILTGTASWADPGFIADWYPRRLPANERLPYYAAHFDLVELNSSFYAIPARKIVARWCEQTPAKFTFDVKLHRLLSRHRTSPKFLPLKLRSLAEVKHDKAACTPKLEQALVKYLLAEFQPMLDSGKLGAFLLQLTPSFSPHKNRLEELETVLDLLSSYQVAVELRHRAWLGPGQIESTLAFFRGRRITLVSVDAPASEHFMVMPNFDATTNPALGYLRLHGRNLKGFTSGKTVAERFDYLYSDQELAVVAARVRQLAKGATQTHVIYNNNSSDYALRNAATFRDMLEGHSRRTSSEGPEWGQTIELDFTAAKANRSAS